MEKLRHRGYLDDGRYAERFARTGLAVRGLGHHRLRAELVRRGVSRALVDQGLAEALHEVSEAAVIERLAQKYWRLHLRDEPERRIRKLWAFLVRRGFPSELVRARLRHLWPRSRRALEGLEIDDEDTVGLEGPLPSRDPGRPARERKQ